MAYYDCQISSVEDYVKDVSFFASKLKGAHKTFFENITADKDS